MGGEPPDLLQTTYTTIDSNHLKPYTAAARAIIATAITPTDTTYCGIILPINAYPALTEEEGINNPPRINEGTKPLELSQTALKPPETTAT
jgi:hypothetical protein